MGILRDLLVPSAGYLRGFLPRRHAQADYLLVRRDSRLSQTVPTQEELAATDRLLEDTQRLLDYDSPDTE